VTWQPFVSSILSLKLLTNILLVFVHRTQYKYRDIFVNTGTYLFLINYLNIQHIAIIHKVDIITKHIHHSVI